MHESSMLHRLGLLGIVSAVAGILLAALLLPVVGGVGLAAKAGADDFNNLPNDLKVLPLPQRSRLLAADGSTLATFYDENRVVVPLAQVAPVMRKAIVAIEDSRFYQHHGVDVKGIIRAALKNSQAGGITQGASTLTQQYVRLVLVQDAKTPAEQRAAHAPTVARKLREAHYAIALEKQLSKDQILERYLNIAYFGDGVYGVGAASQHYFGVPASDLTLPQAALLAGLVQNPAAYDPRLHPQAAHDRRDTVLMRMVQLGDISQEDADRAAAKPVRLHIHSQQAGCVTAVAPYFCDYVTRVIANDLTVLGPDPASRLEALKTGGYTITTTLDPQVQKAADDAVRSHVPWHGKYGAAEAVVEPGTGDVKAIAVNAPYGPGKGQNSVDWATDQKYGGSTGFPSGSTAKVFVLAAALKEGIPLHTGFYAPPTLRHQTGFVDCAGDQLTYPKVGNAEDSEGGYFTIPQATWASVNTFFVKLENRTGVCEPVRIAKSTGLQKASGAPLEQVPSFTLGSNEVSPLDLAEAYATLAASGKHCDPVVVTRIADASGKQVDLPTPQCNQAIDAGIADTVTSVLQGVLDQPTGTAAGEALDRPAAGKTGTVDNFTAAWFAGYTPDLASAVWVGNPSAPKKNTLRGVTIGGQYYREVFGATIPAPIWHDTMTAALKGVAPHDFPGADQSVVRGKTNGVPDVSGESSDQAVQTLRDAGFSPEVAIYHVSSSQPYGDAAYTSPAAGSNVPAGTTVTIYLSDGSAPAYQPPTPAPTYLYQSPAPAPTYTPPTYTPPTKAKPAPSYSRKHGGRNGSPTGPPR